jgi:hypothetical protein
VRMSLPFLPECRVSGVLQSFLKDARIPIDLAGDQTYRARHMPSYMTVDSGRKGGHGWLYSREIFGGVAGVG